MVSWLDGGYECCVDDDLVGFFVVVWIWKRILVVFGFVNFFFFDLMNGVVLRICFWLVVFLFNYLYRLFVFVDSFL